MFGFLAAAFGKMLLSTVLPVIGTAIGGLVVGILGKQLKKVGLDLSVQQERRLHELVIQAIQATEEAARRRSMTSGEKANYATNLIAAARPDLPLQDIRLALDSALPEVRLVLGQHFSSPRPTP